MSDYDFVELRVAYPGHPRVALIDGLDEHGNLKRLWGVADNFYYRREHLSSGKQEQVYRLPAVDNVWEVAERIDGRKALRYAAVHDGALHRVTRDMVEAVAENQLSIAEAVALCKSLPVGRDCEMSEARR